MRRLQDTNPTVARGRPARGGARSQSEIDEKQDGARADALASPTLTGNDAASDHRGGEDGESDLEKYLVHIAHLDLALPVKIELISALRDIMQSFVDRAFGDDPVQQMRRLEGHPDDRQANGGRAAEDKSHAKDARDSMAVLDSQKPEIENSKEDKTSLLRGTNDAGGGKR